MGLNVPRLIAFRLRVLAGLPPPRWAPPLVRALWSLRHPVRLWRQTREAAIWANERIANVRLIASAAGVNATDEEIAGRILDEIERRRVAKREGR